MKDEIKETINILYDFATNVNSDYIYDAHSFDYPLISDCIEDLLDYITNLQEENKRLKDLCDKYEEEHNTAFKLWKTKIEKIPTYEEKKEIQDRIKELEQINEEHRLLNGELREENKELKMTNLALADDVTKNKIIKQEVLTECCGIPIGEIPMLKMQNDEYKQRIDEAIEYIKSNLDNTGWLEIGSQCVEVLINLLQGCDK